MKKKLGDVAFNVALDVMAMLFLLVFSVLLNACTCVAWMGGSCTVDHRECDCSGASIEGQLCPEAPKAPAKVAVPIDPL